jgi:hypothetical protein
MVADTANPMKRGFYDQLFFMVPILVNPDNASEPWPLLLLPENLRLPIDFSIPSLSLRREVID